MYYIYNIYEMSTLSNCGKFDWCSQIAFMRHLSQNWTCICRPEWIC